MPYSHIIDTLPLQNKETKAEWSTYPEILQCVMYITSDKNHFYQIIIKWHCNRLQYVSTFLALHCILKAIIINEMSDLMEGNPMCFNTEVHLFMSITQQKSFKRTNYILINAWRHVSAVLTAILRPTCSTDQV